MLALELKRLLSQRYPLVRSMLEDGNVTFRRRNIDMRWYYRNVVPVAVAGFNPLGRVIFYGRNSHVGKFIEEPEYCLTPHIDWHLYEIFFAVHDYVHIWCVQELARLFNLPSQVELRSIEEAEDRLRYILLLSEAAATVAVDYWQLCQSPVADVIRVPTDFWALTTSYHNADGVGDRYASVLDARERSFFDWLAKAYCTGDFGSVAAVADFLPAHPWLEKEVRMAKKQQALVGDWLTFLGLSCDGLESGQLSASQFARYEDMTRHIGDMIWRCCHGSMSINVSTATEFVFPNVSGLAAADFRFVNVRAVPNLRRSALARIENRIQSKFFLAQYLSCFSHDDLGAPPWSFDSLIGYSGMEKVEDWTGCRVGDHLTSEPVFHVFFPN